MSSKNVLGADNQQVRKKVSNEYLAGFVDGEGCFYVGFGKRNDLPLGWQVITEFHVSQNPGGINVLEVLKERLDCGYIKPNHAKNPKDNSWVLVVKNREDLVKRVIPFFKKYSFHSQKRQEFIIFSQVINLINKKKHLNKKGFLEIVRLVFSLPRLSNKRYSEKKIISYCNLRDYTSGSDC